MRVVSALLLLGILGGCAAQATQGRYMKEGATQEQYMSDRAACIQEAGERRTGAMSNGYGGAVDSGTIVNCRKWESCMKARQYRPDPNGNLHASWTAAVSCSN